MPLGARRAGRLCEAPQGLPEGAMPLGARRVGRLCAAQQGLPCGRRRSACRCETRPQDASQPSRDPCRLHAVPPKTPRWPHEPSESAALERGATSRWARATGFRPPGRSLVLYISRTKRVGCCGLAVGPAPLRPVGGAATMGGCRRADVARDGGARSPGVQTEGARRPSASGAGEGPSGYGYGQMSGSPPTDSAPSWAPKRPPLQGARSAPTGSLQSMNNTARRDESLSRTGTDVS